MSHRLFLTTQGRAKIATAASTAQGIRLTDFVIGSGRDVDFAARLDKNTLVAKRYQGKIASITAVSGVLGQYEIDCVVPQDIGGFAIREFGLLDDAGALVYVGTLPEVVKPDASSIAALDYRIKAVVQIDNPLVSIIIDANVVTATRSWVESHFIPRSALELLYPLGYKYWSHTPDSPKAGFDALFGYETFWRRLKGVHLIAVDDNDPNIATPMTYVGGQGDAVTDGSLPEHYTGYTSYLWERYEPSETAVRYDGKYQYDGTAHYQ